jgi:hypothetical protein
MTVDELLEKYSWDENYNWDTKPPWHGQKKIFPLGLYQHSVTIYKQQKRALNLAFLLKSSPTIELAGKRVAVIGGGISGITMAGALAVLGAKVELFEKGPTLMSLQEGCETRWVHPFLYNWPVEGSKSRRAGQPLFDWEASSAGGVKRQVYREFRELQDFLKKENKVKTTLNRKVSIQDKDKVEIEIKPFLLGADSEIKQFDIVILAIGFGVENFVDDLDPPSYWRNDSLNQVSLEAREGWRSTKENVIFGTGDGGLIDLIRCSIQEYEQDHLHDKILEALGKSEKDGIKKELIRIDQERNAIKKVIKDHKVEDDYLLFMQFEGVLDLASSDYKEKIKAMLRPDTKNYLVGRKNNFELMVNLSKASTLNLFVTFCLDKVEGFKYKVKSFESHFNVDTIKEAAKAIASQDNPRVIVRYGTKRREIIEDLWGGKDKIPKTFFTWLREMELKIDIPKFQPTRRMWPGMAWWYAQNKEYFAHRPFSRSDDYFINHLVHSIERLGIAGMRHDKDLDELDYEVQIYTSIEFTKGKYILQNQFNYVGDYGCEDDSEQNRGELILGDALQCPAFKKTFEDKKTTHWLDAKTHWVRSLFPVLYNSDGQPCTAIIAVSYRYSINEPGDYLNTKTIWKFFKDEVQWEIDYFVSQLGNKIAQDKIHLKEKHTLLDLAPESANQKICWDNLEQMPVDSAPITSDKIDHFEFIFS